jgi:hypothetical protein
MAQLQPMIAYVLVLFTFSPFQLIRIFPDVLATLGFMLQRSYVSFGVLENAPKL